MSGLMKRETDSAQSPGLAGVLQDAIRRSAPDGPGLYVVATPIGNLADVTLRALSTLSRADIVACEDTRTTRRLLERYDLRPKLVSYHEHNAAERRPELLEALASGAVVALVSDAGTPLVSDPGYKLVREAAAAGHRVVPVPGASAVLAGLVSAGLPSDRFWFEGFLPSRGGARARRIADIAGVAATLVLFESPHRLAAALADLATGLGPREAAVGRELTKRFETVLRGTLAELAARFAAGETAKGEVVILIAPPDERAPNAEVDVGARLADLTEEFGTREAAAKLAAETGLPRRELYQRALRLKQDG